jgi:hypothetical protein
MNPVAPVMNTVDLGMSSLVGACEELGIGVLVVLGISKMRTLEYMYVRRDDRSILIYHHDFSSTLL